MTELKEITVDRALSMPSFNFYSLIKDRAILFYSMDKKLLPFIQLMNIRKTGENKFFFWEAVDSTKELAEDIPEIDMLLHCVEISDMENFDEYLEFIK